MLGERIESGWIDAFAEVFGMCAMRAGEEIVILSESRSRAVNVHLAELALGRMGLRFCHLQVPSPPHPAGPVIRSTGACQALAGQALAVRAMAAGDVVVDLTVEGLMHAPETAEILKGGARILNVSNEHPEALARTIPTPELKDRAKEAVKQCRAAREMLVRSDAGTELRVDMEGASTVGVWGWTDRPGTLAHWPGGIVVSFPAKGAVNGRLAYRPGDINLTFKRYFDSPVDLVLEDDYVTRIEGTGTDAWLMRDYLEGFGERDAYATSHVGWGFNPAARYEALEMYDKADTNGTELRAVAGNFLYSTGANEFAGRFTRGHFDLPMMGCDIRLDGVPVVSGGRLA
ncbi:peptidase M29 [Psychromarinibacter sp. C21-152]|uniref:Peptidase M29 n=1 Tax=Psychromarinibacter sediminicola TaxID=3033385 RepID=A0AAE3T974_9RHOB|nr:peptidase M29 [Psychromarinibacter sediminicola]MDF0601553.1 peptidase M29 [Psychromarinibacter sediminicola]